MIFITIINTNHVKPNTAIKTSSGILLCGLWSVKLLCSVVLMQVSSKSLCGLGLVLFFEPELIDCMPQASRCTAAWCQSVDLHSHQIRRCVETQQGCACSCAWVASPGFTVGRPVRWLAVLRVSDHREARLVANCSDQRKWARINFSHPRSLRYSSSPLHYCSSAGFGGNPAFVLYLRLSHHTMRQRKIRYFIDDNMYF